MIPPQPSRKTDSVLRFFILLFQSSIPDVHRLVSCIVSRMFWLAIDGRVDHVLRRPHDKNHGRNDAHGQHSLPRQCDDSLRHTGIGNQGAGRAERGALSYDGMNPIVTNSLGFPRAQRRSTYPFPIKYKVWARKRIPAIFSRPWE